MHILFYVVLLAINCMKASDLGTEINALEEKIIENIIKYKSKEAGTALTRECLFQTQITQFNIPYTVTTPGLYCITTQNSQNNLQVAAATASSGNAQVIQPTSQILSTANQISQYGIQQTTQTTASLTQQNAATQNLITVNDNAARAIIINSNDVVIDLNDNEIIGVGTSNTTGILVNGYSNIIIRNGTIRSMINNGVIFNNNTANGQVSRNVIISNMSFYNNRNGVSMSNVTNALFLNNEAYSHTNNGFLLSQNTNLIINNCISNSNSVSGFSTTGNIGLQCSNCTANSNTVNGFLNNFLIESFFYQCVANENSAAGFVIAPNGASVSVSNNFEDCDAHDNTTQGFQIAGNQTSMQGCRADNNVNGFQINGNNNIVLDCIAQSNTNNGIYLAPALSTNTTSSNCQVRNNTLTSNNIGINNVGVNNHIYSNFASNNLGGDFVGVSNVAISPTPLTAINFTTNIAE